MTHKLFDGSLLDETDRGSLPCILNFSTEHTSSITGLLSTSSSSSSVFVSSSLDGTCKVWDLVTGTLLQTQAFPLPITAIVLDPAEKLLFSGTADGRIFLNTIDVGLVEHPYVDSEDQQIVLNGHNGPITALTFCQSGLISASMDCTACLWDVVNCVIIRRFNHLKGSITNLVVIPRFSLRPLVNHKRPSNQFRVSLLDKCSQPVNSSKGIISLLPSRCSLKGQKIIPGYRSTGLLNQQIHDLETMRTPAAIRLKVETNTEKLLWATKMARHTMQMNKQLQSRLLDLVQCRLLQPPKIELPTRKKRKKNKDESSSLQPRVTE